MRLLGHGEIGVKLTMTVHSASAGAIAAIEAAGGSVTTTRKEKPATEASEG